MNDLALAFAISGGRPAEPKPSAPPVPTATAPPAPGCKCGASCPCEAKAPTGISASRKVTAPAILTGPAVHGAGPPVPDSVPPGPPVPDSTPAGPPVPPVPASRYLQPAYAGDPTPYKALDRFGVTWQSATEADLLAHVRRVNAAPPAAPALQYSYAQPSAGFGRACRTGNCR